MKDKDKIKKHWRIEAELENISKNRWLAKGKKNSLLLTAVKKKDPYLLSRLNFWQWLGEKENFPLQPLLMGKDGEPLYTVGDHSYYARVFAAGKGMDFGDAKAVSEAAKLLAKLHRLAPAFPRRDYCLPSKQPLKVITRFEGLLSDGDAYLKKSKKMQQQWHFLLQRSEKSLITLCDGTLDSLSNDLQLKGGFAYEKVSRKGFVIVEDELKLTDLGDLSENLALFDLWQLLWRYLLYNEKGDKDFFTLLHSYEKKRALSDEERKVLLAMLHFPYALFKAVSKGYKKEEIEKILQREVKRQDFYAELLEKGRLKNHEDCH